MEIGSILIMIEKYMKENMLMILKKEKEKSVILMEEAMKDISLMDIQKEKLYVLKIINVIKLCFPKENFLTLKVEKQELRLFLRKYNYKYVLNIIN